MDKGAESGRNDQHYQGDTSLSPNTSGSRPGIAVAVLLVVLFDFAMWFIVPDGTTYHRDFGSHELDVHLSPLPLLVTGLLAGAILLILSRLRK